MRTVLVIVSSVFGKITRFPLILAAMFLHGGAAFAQTGGIRSNEQPQIPKGFAGQPEFETPDGKFAAGTAFLMRTDRPFEVVLLTALHLFGPAGGLPVQKRQIELPGFARRAALKDLVSEDLIKMDLLPVPVPSSGKEESDVAIFRSTGLSTVINPGRFAEVMPSIGETIWLVARVRVSQGSTLHPATVIEIRGQKIYCRFFDQTIETNGASGGPYVNAKGEVIGIHAGSIKTPGDKRGVILWAGSIREILRQL
jgi:hypothetical protein